MKSRAYQTTPTPVLDLLPSLLTTKTNRPLIVSSVVAGVDTVASLLRPRPRLVHDSAQDGTDLPKSA